MAPLNLEARKSKIKVLADSLLSESRLPDSWMAIFLLRLHLIEGLWELCGVSLGFNMNFQGTQAFSL